VALGFWHDEADARRVKTKVADVDVVVAVAVAVADPSPAHGGLRVLGLRVDGGQMSLSGRRI